MHRPGRSALGTSQHRRQPTPQAPEKWKVGGSTPPLATTEAAGQTMCPACGSCHASRSLIARNKEVGFRDGRFAPLNHTSGPQIGDFLSNRRA